MTSRALSAQTAPSSAGARKTPAKPTRLHPKSNAAEPARLDVVQVLMPSDAQPIDDRGLAWPILRSALRFNVGLGVVLFLCSGDLRDYRAWTFIALQWSGAALASFYLICVDRDLGWRRLRLEQEGEKDPVQKRAIRRMAVAGFALFLIAGLDHRYAVSDVPYVLYAVGCVLFALGTLGILWVFAANSYAASTVVVEREQKVIASGPYRFVRHPMYSCVLLSNLAIPLILGSYWAELVLPVLVWIFVVRLRDEEELLRRELPGYDAYLSHTQARLIPGLY